MPVVEVGGQPAVLALLGLVDPAEQPAPLDVGRVDELDDARPHLQPGPGGRPMIRLISSEMVSSSLARSHSQLPICAIRWASASWRRLASSCRSARRSSVTSRAITLPPITAPRSSGRGT